MSSLPPLSPVFLSIPSLIAREVYLVIQTPGDNIIKGTLSATFTSQTCLPFVVVTLSTPFGFCPANTNIGIPEDIITSITPVVQSG